MARKNPWIIAAVCCIFFALLVQGEGPFQKTKTSNTRYLLKESRIEFRKFYSPALNKLAQYSIYLPPAYDLKPKSEFPTVYFLHGMFNDHTSWTQKQYGNLPLLIEKNFLQDNVPQFVMVHPNGENSFYTDFLSGTPKYESFIHIDLIREIEQHFRVDRRRSHRSIAGTSMGGYGALKIAIKHPHLYSAVAAGSPIIFLGQEPSRQLTQSSSYRIGFFVDLFKPIFGIPFDHGHWRENSVEVLARIRKIQNLKIYIAYGTADRYLDMFPMEKGIQNIHKILTKRSVAHMVRAYEGEPHGWRLIRNHLEEILKFITRDFK